MSPTFTSSIDSHRERALLWRAQALCSAAQAAGIIGLAWYALVLGAGPVGVGAVFAAALAPVSAAGFYPRAARALLSRGRRAPLWGGQAVMGAALLIALCTAVAGVPAVPAVAALCLGLGRALFDTAAVSILHANVAHERQHRALRELTQRYAAGQPVGVALALVGGFASGGPLGSIAVGALLATIGVGFSLRHHRAITHAPPARVAFSAALAESRLVLLAQPRLRAAIILGAVGVAIATGQAALLISWFAEGPDVRGEALVPTLLIAVLGAHMVLVHAGAWIRTLEPRRLLVVAFSVQAAGLLVGWRAPDAATAAVAYGLTLVAAATLVELATRTREETVPAGLAPAIGTSVGGVWALAGALGGITAAVASLVLGLGAAFAVLGLSSVAGGVGALAASSLGGRGSGPPPARTRPSGEFSRTRRETTMR